MLVKNEIFLPDINQQLMSLNRDILIHSEFLSLKRVLIDELEEMFKKHIRYDDMELDLFVEALEIGKKYASFLGNKFAFLFLEYVTENDTENESESLLRELYRNHMLIILDLIVKLFKDLLKKVII